MKSINFAIIGFGSIAKAHALAAYDANLRYNLPFTLNLKYVVTRKPCEIKLPGVKNCINVQEVLEDESIDFISISTPNDSHLEYVEKAVQYYKAIYCEKPLASTYEDALKMTEAVNKNNVKNAVAFMYRFLPAVRLLKREIANKTIGDIIDFKIKIYHKSYLNSNKKGTWRTLKSSGGGALLDLGAHLIDLIFFTLGEIEKIDSKTRIYFKERSFVDEIAYCDIKLFNGVQGSIEVSRIFAEADQRDSFEIYGTKGSMKLNFKNPYVLEIFLNEENMVKLVKPDIAEDMQFYPDERNVLGYFQSAHTASIINFANSIYENKDIGIAASFEDGLKCQKIIKEAYENPLK
ncbi:Gfo/Idh/MocA family oxidoreductase [Caloramator sp. E03]|uniref:Gfo/Idh/MocA family protein n=1 Tax=Caloramator sp. E03 TaxID=2576307 RepID=UPI001110613B|nr:Gfo/Idh/MocA family oxidoreductase [Caloramator sp. E03]QCX33144.1 Gfo/Idh/MocA family oxidoreductase [Caloramator sp. E03]